MLGAVAFVVARPRVDGFLRRQVYRFPALARRVRAAVAQSRRSAWQSPPTVPADETELTDDARQIVRDLRRAAGRTP